MKEVYDFLKKCRTYYLATTDNGQARVRPFGTVDIFEDRLYIQTGKSKAVSKQIQKNPFVEICAFDGETWLRLSGELVRDDRREAKQHMLERYPELGSMYSPDDDNTEVLYFKNATANFSSFTHPPKTVKF
ncbi:MAG: pyridoxamine 5'-phosphate oxidase family protein [Abditibacteriota bacterium]|nr:pyridoxamine 5'-phosphate oxidase family protein [Abditibacteriota bacterium]